MAPVFHTAEITSNTRNLAALTVGVRLAFRSFPPPRGLGPLPPFFDFSTYWM